MGRTDFREMSVYFDMSELVNGVIGNTSRGVRKIAHKRDTDFTPKEAADLITKRFPRHNEPCSRYTDIEEDERYGCGCVPCSHYLKSRLWAFLIWRYFISQESLSTCHFEFHIDSSSDRKRITKKRLAREIEFIRLAREGRRLDRKPPTGRGRGRPPLNLR
jgi:hypothetical protein